MFEKLVAVVNTEHSKADVTILADHNGFAEHLSQGF